MTLDLVTYGAFFMVTALTYGLITMGLNVQWGATGLFNVGVAGFVAIGAYTSVHAARHSVPWEIAVVLGGLMATLVGVVFAFAALRVRRQGSQWLQTLKTAAVSTSGLSARHEWEVPLQNDALSVDAFVATAV